jgi:hypothetical protein
MSPSKMLISVGISSILNFRTIRPTVVHRPAMSSVRNLKAETVFSFHFCARVVKIRPLSCILIRIATVSIRGNKYKSKKILAPTSKTRFATLMADDILRALERKPNAAMILSTFPGSFIERGLTTPLQNGSSPLYRVTGNGASRRAARQRPAARAHRLRSRSTA